MIRALLLLTFAAIAAGPQAQRDTSAAKPTLIGTASISGLVTLGDEAQTVVRRAVITLQSSDGLDIRSALTDDDGRFMIGGLPAGRYSVQAVKAAHVTSAYGARRPGRPGTPVVLAERQQLTLSLTLPKGAALAGRLTRENGLPVPDVVMMAIPIALMTAGGTLSSSAHEFRTNDLGEFRIYGLAPGSYALAALPSFGNGEFEIRSEADYDAIARALAKPALPATSGPNAPVSTQASEPPRGFAPLYFPGTPVGAHAVAIAVGPGDVKEGLDFVLSTTPMSTIRGTVIGSAGQPVQAASVSIEMVGPPLPFAQLLAPRINRPNPRGEFSISGVSPGSYRIRARAGGVSLRADGSLQSLRSEAQTEWAVAEVTVDGRDVNALSMTLQPGRLIQGRVVADGAAAPASWAGTFVVIQPVRQGPGSSLSGGLIGGVDTRRGQVNADGTFEVIGLEPHAYEVGVTLPASLSTAGWTLGGIRAADRDLRDAPLTFAEGSLEGVEIVLTTKVTELSGRLSSESGTPATDYFIVAFPADRTLWHPASPRVRVMRPAADGLFSTRDLPPGTYRLAALTDVEPDEHRRAEFLESIYDAAISVTVTPGSVTRQDVRIK